MINTFCKYQLWEVSKDLVDVAQGRKPADIVIINSRLINVCTKEIQDNMQVAIVKGRIAMVGDCSHCIKESTKVIDAKGQYIAPGFMDGHIHIESSMLSVGEYAKAVVPHGTTGVYIDPHEICNVLGLEGVKCMIQDSKRVALKTMVTTPSCVPAIPGFEDTGSFIGPNEIKQTMEWKEVVGLGEMMNFVGINASNETTHAIVGETLKAGKIVTGHYSMPETERGLNSYIASGVRCCHESTREIDALAKMRMGMYAMLREGSAWHDLQEVAKAITKHEVDSRFACLISDDSHPHTLINEGHLDHIVARAIEEGIDPISAIQMVTINCAQCYQMDQDLGSIAPSKCADIVFIDNLEKCHVTKVIVDGEVVAENGEYIKEIKDYVYPEWATHSIHIKDKINKETFIIPSNNYKETVRVIEVIPAKVATIERHITLPVINGSITADTTQDTLKAFVFERHHETGKIGKGFVKGFGIKGGALAQTVAHDAHNLFVVGDNDEDMALACNELIKCGGGMVVVKNGKIIGKVELPIAGLISDKSLEETNKQVIEVEKAWRELGCTHPSPFMTMGIIPLACLPTLRLTDRGIVDCTTFSFVDLIVKS